MKKVIPILLSLLFLVIIWEIIVLLINNTALFPHIPELLITVGKLIFSKSFYLAVGATILRGITGIIFSIIAASLTAIIFAKYKLMYEFFRPFLTFIRTVPVISFILLALIFLNPEIIPLIIAFLTMYPLLTENLTNGIYKFSPELSIMCKQFRIGKINCFTQVYYPQLKPFLFSGLASAMGFGWRAIIMGEVLSQCTYGIGSEMKKAQLFINVPELMGWTIVAVTISFVFDKGISRIRNLNFPLWFQSVLYRKQYPRPIRMDSVTFRYDKQTIIENFSYTFEPGSRYAITGASGSGKTTLLSLINETLKPIEGSLTRSSTDIIGSVFQKPLLLPHLTVKDNILLPLTNCMKKMAAEKEVDKVLGETEITEYKDRYPDELSFGQQQRVAIARALAYPCAILIIDEPFKGLDKELKNRIMQRVIEEQAIKNQTIIFTSHDPEEIQTLSNHIISLS